MKLLVVSTWLPWPLDNGSRVRAYHLLRQLGRRHELTLLSFGSRSGRPEDADGLRGFCQRVEVVPQPTLRGTGLRWNGLLSSVPRYYAQTDSPEMRDLVAGAVRDHDLAIGLQVDAARYLTNHTGIPRVFEEAEVGLFRERAFVERDPIRRFRFALTWLKHRGFVRQLVSSFERTTVVSEKEREHLRSIGCDAGRVHVVPNGVDMVAAGPRPPRVNRLIYPGSVTYSANLDAVGYFAREVLPLVRRKCPHVTFSVTGSTDGVDVGGLEGIAGVVFTGWLPDIDRLIASSAACVVPLRIGGGTRLKVLKAMALGAPVVSTTKGVEGLDVEPGVHLLVGDSPRDFAEQVVRVITRPELAARLVAEARLLVSGRYTWDRAGDAIEKVIEMAALSRNPACALAPSSFPHSALRG